MSLIKNRLTPYIDQLSDQDIMDMFQEITYWRIKGNLPENSKLYAFAMRIAGEEYDYDISIRSVKDEILYELASRSFMSYWMSQAHDAYIANQHNGEPTGNAQDQ